MYAKDEGGSARRLRFPFVIRLAAVALSAKATTFPHSIKSIHPSKLRPEAVRPACAQPVRAERKVKSPVGRVAALPDTAMRP